MIVSVAILVSAALVAAPKSFADTPDSTKSSIQWNETRISKKISNWKTGDLLAAQVVFRAAIEGNNPCGFSQEYLTAAPQLFQGELDGRKTGANTQICGKPIIELTGDETQKCANQHAARVCSRLK